MTDFIIFKELYNTGIIILNRPESLNALNLEMFISLKKQLNLWKKNKQIKRVMIKGIGKSFCAGGDVKSIYYINKDSKLREDFFKHEYSLNYIIKSFNKPYLAIWNGIVMGGGVGISVYGKYRIVTENAKLAMPESAIGFFPDVGTSYILSRMKNSLGLYLGLTGHVLNYYEICKLSFANYFVSEKDLYAFEENFIKHGSVENKLTSELPILSSKIVNNQSLINIHFSSMNIETIFKSLKNDKTDFAKETLNHLLTRCPTSLALTCEIFKIAKKISFKDCLQMDYYFSQIMIRRDDFINGINEVLVNKTHSPKWNPNSITGINDKIKVYFNEILSKKLALDI